MSASNEMKRFRATLSAENRRKLGFDLHSQTCVLASEADAALLAKDAIISQLRGEVARSQWMQSRLLRASYFDSDGQRCWYVFNLEGERLAFGGTEIEAIDAAMAKP